MRVYLPKAIIQRRGKKEDKSKQHPKDQEEEKEEKMNEVKIPAKLEDMIFSLSYDQLICLNQKTVSIFTENNYRWNVSPSLLSRIIEE